ncbi:hypothetical protein GUITHDRAFT_146502 [Guillardia theta CCMP2712]|uniref:Uncharacterized protein n=1 Tax=Guillardia theta (strain CCMP2712) TaxID=905079 RepID=L1IGP4_GUITC|nr:hypothetical protein GUITHDRAFT_146502 [Guillardia theta CCMP2712]EKX35393.1 hypothetical protein GUITHDRAFT_146502 [Guillardia theta CCMP2712]|eukprot:XP_005822373.1 hypothetical protein GUITHDRAFT_146502 [Guillardia theta CCMP2712]
MGKALGFRYAGKGPGIQKSSKMARKYLVANKVKTGKMSDLDFGIEAAPKIQKEQAETGLNNSKSNNHYHHRHSSPAPAPLATGNYNAPVITTKREKTLAEQVGEKEYQERVKDADEFRAAKSFAEEKTNAKKKKKCEPC